MPQPGYEKRPTKAKGWAGPPIPADIAAHNKMAREQTELHYDQREGRYRRKPMAVSLAPVGKKPWNE